MATPVLRGHAGARQPAQCPAPAVGTAAGDRVVFATDGVVEARDAADEMYTAERFARLLEGLRDVPVGTLVERAVREVQRFAQDRQLDDRTVLAMQVNRVGGDN